MGGIGGPELFLILVVVLLVFGPKKIPEVARGLGKGLREFRKLSTDFQREINLSAALEEEEKRIVGPSGASSRPPGPPVPGTGASSPGAAASVATASAEEGASSEEAPSSDEPVSSGEAEPPGEAGSPPADAPVESSDSRRTTDGS